jgi:hypothetical protein
MEPALGRRLYRTALTLWVDGRPGLALQPARGEPERPAHRRLRARPLARARVRVARAARRGRTGRHRSDAVPRGLPAARLPRHGHRLREHVVAGRWARDRSGVAAALFFLVPLALAFAFRRLPEWRALWLPSLFAVPAIIAVQVVFSVLGDGAAVRAASITWFLWVGLLAWWLLRVASSESPAEPAIQPAGR